MEMIEARGDNNNNNNSCEEVIITTTTSVDWRGRPSNPIKHGGMKAAAFVLGITYYSLSLSRRSNSSKISSVKICQKVVYFLRNLTRI